MDKKISKETRQELVEALGQRYRESSKGDKARILDEFTAISGYHRKHAVRLLADRHGGSVEHSGLPEHGGNRGIYDEAVKTALVMTWEAADRICGKRLKAILPELVAAMERHGHIGWVPGVRQRVLAASAATIDRLLAPIRRQARPRRRRHRFSAAIQQIPVRTFADWHDPNPGYLEIDFVVHGGGLMAGSFLHTLVATDVSSGWTECVPLLAREQSLVVEGLQAIFRQIPFPVLGLDSDNDSAFINETLTAFCRESNLAFTRCRAYHRNDPAWIEQKNGAVVRRLVGYERFTGIVAGQTLAHLYQTSRLYVNYFQPSFKLREKTKAGAKVRRNYDPPATPCARLLAHPAVTEETKSKLQRQREPLDPVELLHRIREGQAALATRASPHGVTEGPGRETLAQYLTRLPELWRSGEVRPTHRSQPPSLRHWRTRTDPFENVWFEVLRWLQNSPDATAKTLFTRLQKEYPDRFPDPQLRTLQRRVREWRRIMARKLVYACISTNGECTEVTPVGAGVAP